jgi:two-component system sensor histidine kinase HydH
MKAGRISLGLKFSIAAAILIIAAMLSVAALTINYQKESLRQNTFQSNIVMTRSLAHDATESLLVFDPLRLEILVRTVLDATSCTYAMITDKDGIIVAHTKRSMLGVTFASTADHDLSHELSGTKDRVRDSTYENNRVREFSHPIMIGDEIMGFAAIAYSLNAMEDIIETRISNLRKYIYMISGVMLFVGIGSAFAVSNFLTKPLTRLKNRMLDIQAGNLDVEAENPGIVKCWERLNCRKSDCPSYGRTRCWAIAGTFCHGDVQGTFAQKIGDCRNCVVYRESCSDEIKELVEVFNQMVKDLRFNLQQLEKANIEKARMERLSALGEMAATVAHETKNPLNSIRMATSYLKNNFQGAILSEFLSIIDEEVSRINSISTDFLGFSKPQPLNIKNCSIVSLVESTAALVRQEATEKNIEIIVFVEGTPPLIPCDFSKIKQALLNLLLNALDASKPGDTVEIAIKTEPPFMYIAVSDTGDGIDSADIPNIFKPFFTTKTRGSGLGLAIVERIVKEHGGEIDVESFKGRGTKFTIRLKVEQHAET